MRKNLIGSIMSMLVATAAVAAVKLTEAKPQVIVMLGPPGAGKGTVAVRLADQKGVPHISTGDLFRENLKNKTELGAKAKEYMEKGLLVPDSLVLDMLLSRVQADDCQKGYILDGFPRTLPQAEALSAKLKERANVVAVNLEVADKLLVDRIVKRRVCTGCGAPFHIVSKPPKKEGVCDRCKGELIQRSDDTEEVVTKRLSVYHEQTAPVTDFYKKQGCVISIDGAKSLQEVFNQVVHKVER